MKIPAFDSLSWGAILASVVLLSLSWILVTAVQRLWFSPLAKVPGPKLAALSTLYEFYYDCICTGKYVFEIQKMHHKYGKRCILYVILRD